MRNFGLFPPQAPRWLPSQRPAVVHTFGDSHSNRGWDSSQVNMHHLGPVLCYSFGKDKLARCDIRRFGVANGDTVIFCFGEIDCRCHIHKHVTLCKSYQSVIEGIVDSYADAIRTNITVSGLSLKNVCIYNVVPPVERHNTMESPEYPYLGTDGERKQYVLYFNERLNKVCRDNGWVFFDVYDLYADANGFLSKGMSDGNVHVSTGSHLRNFVREHLL